MSPNRNVDLHEITVLAVDDIEDNLDLIEEYLDGEVWAVHRARSGEEAIRLANEVLPDVILLDLMMPNMNGWAVLREIRASKVLDQIPIILQTAYTSIDNVIMARRVGCEYCLCKPLSKKRLLEEMRKCLSEHPRRRDVADDKDDYRAKASRVRTFAKTLEDTRVVLGAGHQLADDSHPTESLDCLKHMIPNDSTLGRRLIRLANSSAYGSRYPARTVIEAVVRIGIRETRALIQRAASSTRVGQETSRILNTLDLLETLTAVFPGRTATPEGLLSLLGELNAATAAVGSSSHGGV